MAVLGDHCCGAGAAVAAEQADEVRVAWWAVGVLMGGRVTPRHTALRRAAMRSGEHLYAVGLVCCDKGHTAGRYTKVNMCAQCMRERALARERENPERTRREKRAKYLRNRDANLKRTKEWYQANTEAALAYQSARRKAIRDSGGVWRNKFSPFPIGTLAELRRKQRGKCAVCRASLDRAGQHVDHITPIARGGTNHTSNLQLLCPRCNTSKGAKDPLVFMQARGFLL